MSETILVCGGAGYIGSHTVAALLECGRNVVAVDNLEKGHREAVWDGAKLRVGDLRDPAFIEAVMREEKPDAVIDFAAYSLVGESVTQPLKYYGNNLLGTMNLLNAMIRNGVDRLVFSSTAAVYGMPRETPIPETAAVEPINPYGESKLAVEKMLRWTGEAHGLRYAALRYFNAAGAHVSGKIGEAHDPETHLIPNIVAAAMRDEEVTIFGDDYATTDGTCIRDYIHVTDLADAHILALDALKTGESVIYNLGSGKGFSNLEILKAAGQVIGREIRRRFGPRRPGDPDVLVASADKIIRELHWQPRYSSLETILQTAWAWANKAK